MTAHHTFAYELVLDDELKVGDVLDGRDVDHVVICPTDWRRLDLLDALEVHGLQDPADLVLLRKPFRLARTAPTGPLSLDYQGQLSCPEGWEIMAFEPVHLAFGPLGDEVAALLAKAENAQSGSPAGRAYADAVEALYADPEGGRAYRAAYEALEAIRADADFWSRRLGPEVLALVARDLIGSTPDWTQEAYAVLTRPWRDAFNEAVHPADGVVVA